MTKRLTPQSTATPGERSQRRVADGMADETSRTAVHVRNLLKTAVDAGPSDDGSRSFIGQTILAAVMDMLSTPIILTDRRLTIIHANRAAQGLLMARAAVWANGDQLTTEALNAQHLSSAICAAARGCPLRRTLVLEVPGMVSLAIWLQPIAPQLQSSALVCANGLVALIVKPLRARPAMSTAALRQHYALTPRQADVVKLLATGASLEDTAARLGIALTTARSHLAQCFAKTRTHRQPDLVALALALEAPVME